MAIITQSELDVRLTNPSNASKGRTIGATEIPSSLRSIIGFQARFDTAKNVAEAFDVAPITAHLAKESYSDPEARKEIKSKLGEVRDLALEKMLTSMGVVSSEKIKKLSVRGALNVVKTMAHVIEKTGEKDQNPGNTNIVIYAPQVKTESDFANVIEINSNPGTF